MFNGGILMAIQGCDNGHNRCVGYDECEYCRVNGFCAEIGYCQDDCHMCADYDICQRPERFEELGVFIDVQ